MSADRHSGKPESGDSRPRPSSREAAKQPPATEISAADFPALRSFLRGYFHQDMKDEYGSPAEAAREFCSDASAEERASVAAEWARFLDRTKGQPLDAINKILTGPLGSSYSLTEEHLTALSAIF